MTTRWWAPARPGTQPDHFDLALLEPGTDARMDLANSLIAHHRVGAAACEAARDEAQLVANLVKVRAAFAPQIVQSVSKSIGEGPYAGLLVRDVADAAESAVLDLYRAACARGVTPTLAAQRAGAVFGVPADGLGQYRALACTPAANPVALADAADAALWAHVEKVCGEEVDDRETVSKARERERTRETTELQALFDRSEREYHGDDPEEREPNGRFARLRGRGGPAEVGTTERDREVRAVSSRERRETRAVREVRQVDKPKAKEPASREAAGRERTAASRERAAASREVMPVGREVTRREGAAKARIFNAAVRVPDAEAGADVGVAGNARWMQQTGDYQHHLYASLRGKKAVLHLGQAEWTKLVTNSDGDGTAEEARMFRVGHLENNVDADGAPVIWNQDDEDDSDYDPEAEKLQRKAQSEYRDGDYGDALHAEPVNGTSAANRMATAVAYAKKNGNDLQDPEVQEDIEYMAGRVVFRNSPTGGLQGVIVEHGPELKVRQIVLNEVEGRADGYGNVDLNPDAIYRLSRTPKVFFDSKLGATVEVYSATKITEQDAASAQQRRRAKRIGKADREYHGDDPDERGRDGRFVRVRLHDPELQALFDRAAEREREPVREVERVREVRPVERRETRQVREVRETRTVSREAPAREAATREPAARTREVASRERDAVTRESRPPTREVSARVARAISRELERMPLPDFGLEANHDYVVMSAAGMESMLDALDYDRDDESISLPRRLRESLVGQSAKSKMTRERIGQYIADDVDFFGDYREGKGVMETSTVDDLSENVVRLFEEHPHLQQVYIEEMDQRDVIGAPDQTEVVMMGHSGTIDATHVIEVDREYDHDYHGELLDEGERRSVKLDWQEVHTKDGKVQGYYVTRPLLHRWRLVNTDDIPPGRQTGPRQSDDERG